jgi:Protein of unknown function (DUF3662)/FHA domain
MGMLQRFESRLEQAVSGAFAKAFRSAVQPVELAAALQREVDNSAQILSRNRRLVPNTFVIELSQVDHDRLQPYSQTLTDELVEMLREHAEEQHYVFAGPVAISFTQEADLVTGRFRVRSQATAQVTPNASRGRPAPSGRATASVEVNGTRHPLTPPGLVIGRGAEADLRINDPGVSRRHAEFRVTEVGPGSGRGPQVSVANLGSTNGTLLDGQRVRGEASLRDGSVVRVGSTDVTVRLAREEG